MTFKAVEEKTYPAIWNKKGEINEGDSITGIYVSREEANGKYGDTVFYILELEDGNHASIVGSADIRNKFDQIETGKLVQVTFKGFVETDKGSPKKVYEVLVDE